MVPWHLLSYVQDYHWWWRSFLTSGFTAVYLFIYAVHYFFSKLQIIGAASTFLYFGYTMIMVLIFFLFTGEAFTVFLQTGHYTDFKNVTHYVAFVY